MKYVKEYIETLPNGNILRVKISATLDNTNERPEEVLPKVALCSRNFYLALGRELADDNHTEANKQESTKEFLMQLKKEFKSPEHKEHINRFLNRCRVASCGISPEAAEKS